ncbi:MAG: hypothetical protein IH849_14015 [Acidobacteria bacterium]|nr:hypothetical protein [Acidobacteriota bacterium]
MMMKIDLFLTTIALAVLPSLVAAPAGADTIYMKNGRVITSSFVRVEGDQVYVRLLGGEVRFPLSLVDRIVGDDAAEQPPSVVPVPEPASDLNDPPGQGEPAQGDPDAPSDPAGQGDPAPGADPEDPEPAPEETREYWQNRLAPLNKDLARMDGELQSLRSRNGADVEAQIRRLAAARARVQAQVDTIVREARRLGVPPGWLR